MSAKAPLQSSWLSGPKFLKTNERPFKPSEGFRLKRKQAKQDPTDEPSTELCTMLSETQVVTANTFECHSMAHTRNSCALQPTFYGFCREIVTTGQTQASSSFLLNLKFPNNVFSA